MKQIIVLCAIAAVGWSDATASPVDMMVGARGYGLGGAYVAIADDPSAAYWNPARLSQVNHISLMESNWIFQDVEGINVNYLSFAVPLGPIGVISGSWLLNHATLEYGETDAFGELTMVSNTANENTFSLSFGRKLFDELLFLIDPAIGFSVNRYTFTTEQENGAGLGFDLAATTTFPYGLSLGFIARNLGGEVMGYRIDPELRFGLGFSQLLNEMHRVTAGIDGVYKINRDYEDGETLEPAANNMKAFGGLEYAIVLQDLEIAVRGGGNGMVLHNTIGNYTFTGGLGVKFLGYSVQYAFVGATQRDATLGYSHRVSLTLELDRLYPGQKGFSDGKSEKEE